MEMLLPFILILFSFIMKYIYHLLKFRGDYKIYILLYFFHLIYMSGILSILNNLFWKKNSHLYINKKIIQIWSFLYRIHNYIFQGQYNPNNFHDILNIIHFMKFNYFTKNDKYNYHSNEKYTNISFYLSQNFCFKLHYMKYINYTILHNKFYKAHDNHKKNMSLLLSNIIIYIYHTDQKLDHNMKNILKRMVHIAGSL